MAKIDNVAFSMEHTTPLITALLDVDPDTLNLAGDSTWITCCVILPQLYETASVDATSILLDELIAPAF